MKAICWCVLFVVWTGCAHVHHSTGRFTPPDATELILQLTRHVDRVTDGPDLEEDHELVLTLREYSLRRQLPIPSATVKPKFVARRFGADTRGEVFDGYIVLKRMTPDRIDASLNLRITARTKNRTYVQQVRFRGDYVFERMPTP